MELKITTMPVKSYNKQSSPASKTKNGSFGVLPFSSKQTVSDLYVFNHHIYEYKKGLRNLVLTTEKASNRETIEERLKRESIPCVVHEIAQDKINVYFGKQECIDVIATFSQHLNLLTPEQDFILGTMLGYDTCKQCSRYLKMREKHTSD